MKSTLAKQIHLCGLLVARYRDYGLRPNLMCEIKELIDAAEDMFEATCDISGQTRKAYVSGLGWTCFAKHESLGGVS